ncbi:FAD-dependent monooxygenase [Streptomyces sp. NPDC127049]|uniref:FAD-dependent monooxygenase n=1 Tax=Streptomyces sp. NPDC127049 TaxID=3347118 RepID=UPI00364AF064
MHIVIAGAGIGGLVAALSLHSAGLRHIEVLETVPEIRPMGAGVNLLPNAVRELAALGLSETLSGIGADLTELGYYNHLGQTIWREPRGRADGCRWPQLAVHRGALQQALLTAVRQRLGAAALTTGARVTGFAPQAGGVTVELAPGPDGAPRRIDAAVLIGADGIRSAVRRTLYPREGEPSSDGTTIWRGITRAAPFHGGRAMAVLGDGRWKAVVYPLSTTPGPDGLVPVNWAISRAAAERADRFPAAVTGWARGDLRLDALLGEAEQAGSFPLLDRDPLPRWSFGPVTLLGDAAHAMAPMGSNATTQAVVDGRSLAHALARHPDPVEALAAYDRERRPRMNHLQLLNRAKGPERVIDLVQARAPRGFHRVEDVVPAARLAQVTGDYARAAGSDTDAANAPSPYEPPHRPHAAA